MLVSSTPTLSTDSFSLTLERIAAAVENFSYYSQRSFAFLSSLTLRLAPVALV